MLKKLLIALPLGIFLAAGLWVWERIQTNPEGVIPVPYVLPAVTEKISVDAPLLLVGDRMAERFGLFKETLSLDISVGLSKPLKTGVLASENTGLHRTLRLLENLEKWPKIMLYTGGSEELVEEKFLTPEIATIRRNFDRYADDRWRTLLMVWPESARLIYDPLVRQVLPAEPTVSTREMSEAEYQARLELSYRIYEIELEQLVDLARSKDVVLIFMTVPVNLDIPPKKTCSVARTSESTLELAAIRELIRQQDYKAAYPRAKVLAENTLANAEVFFLYGQVAQRIGRGEEAKNALRRAAAFDCKSWRANEVTNAILRKVAQDHRVTLFDFADMVDDDWRQNTTFFDEIYPQNLYYEKASKALATVLRKMLKL
jgi:tetratricopeptide (TPR) repeat protein